MLTVLAKNVQFRPNYFGLLADDSPKTGVIGDLIITIDGKTFTFESSAVYDFSLGFISGVFSAFYSDSEVRVFLFETGINLKIASNIDDGLTVVLINGEQILGSCIVSLEDIIIVSKNFHREVKTAASAVAPGVPTIEWLDVTLELY